MSGAPLTLGSAPAGSSDYRSELSRVHERNLQQQAARQAAEQAALRNAEGSRNVVQGSIAKVSARISQLESQKMAIDAELAKLRAQLSDFSAIESDEIHAVNLQKFK